MQDTPPPTPDPRPGEDAFAFTAVDWLPPFRLEARALIEGGIEVVHPATALLPFARLQVDAASFRVLPDPPGEAARLATLRPAELRARLAALPAADVSRAARARRWTLGTALAAAAATEALALLGGAAGWQAAAATRRRWYLRALDAGTPPAAAEVAATCRVVPQALRSLGNALPTAEALRLLAPLGRICELGAGTGLFARALQRGGLEVAASDRASGAGIGLAFPVQPGLDATATLAWFAARGPLPPLLMLWPGCAEDDWATRVVAEVGPGQCLALASPEVEFCAAGGLATAPGRAAAGPGWAAAADLAARLARDFEALGEAPVVAAGWPLVTTPLRLWRRRGG